MKKGKDYMVFKYVYRSINGVWLRDDNISCSREYIQLAEDFPYIDQIASFYPTFKIFLKKGNREITAWKDKHANIILRIIDKSIIQSKINF